MKLLIYVGMRDGKAPSQAALGGATLMPTGLGTWLLHDDERALPSVGEAISSGKVISAYVGPAEMPSEKPWLAVEWHHRIVADPEVAWQLDALLPGWTGEHAKGAGVVVFSPDVARASRPEKARSPALVTMPEPRWWEIDLIDAEHDPSGWFGEFGHDDVGGWVTLLSAALRGDEGSGTVGNLAALGLKLNRDKESLWAARAAGAIKVTAVGMRREQVETRDLSLLGSEWGNADITRLKRSDASFCIAVRIAAPVDPKVIIGSGTIFEQLGPGQAQNLAVATEWHDTIDAGQIVSMVLPAWCLNRDLAPPSGQPLRLTPLTFVGQSTDQRAVWDDIDRRRSSQGSQ